MRKICLFLFWIFIVQSNPTHLNAQSIGVNPQSVATNLDIPWDLEHWGGDSLIFTQRSGELIRLDIPNVFAGFGRLDIKLDFSNALMA